MRSIDQPGPPRARAHPVGGGARPRLLVHAGSRPAAAGSRAPRLCRGRVCRRRAEHASGGALGPFAYVMPALSKTGENAAFYSDTFRPAGVTRLKLGAMTLGERDGAPFFHCHGLWTEADGRVSGGHMLPEETMVAEPFEVEAFGIDGAMFTAEPDPETNFKLFGPVARAGTSAKTTSRAFALRLRPNQDFAGALEDVLPAARHSPRANFTAASAPPSARASPMAAASCRSRPNLRSRSGTIAPGAERHAGGGARCRAGRLSRRHRRGPAGARRQSGADDDGAGAGSAG